MERFITRAVNCNVNSEIDLDSENDLDSESEANVEDDTERPKKKYKQKVRKSWLKDKRLCGWMEANECGDRVKCKFCNCTLQAKLCSLLSHADSLKHKTSSSPFTRGIQQKISFAPQCQDEMVKKAELSYALFVCCHTSIMSIDHLSTLSNLTFNDSALANNLKLGRTKCCGLLKNVLSPYFKKLILKDIQGEPYSIIIDESTDISIQKYLGIVIRYYSHESKAIVNTFLKLANVEDSTARSITSAILKTLEEYGLDVKQAIGVGTDNASVMVGVNNGVIANLRKYNEKIILVPCVCHSIQLAVSKSSKSMPDEIEYLISETYNWFSKSPARQTNYFAIFSAINNGNKPLKIPRASDTRWLSIEVAVKRISEQWLELKTHFEIASSLESSYKANHLKNLYSDVNLAYLEFLKPILKEVQIVNKMFESNSADPLKLFGELNLLLSFLCSFVVPRSEDFDPLNSEIVLLTTPPVFHYNFERFIQENLKQKTIDLETEKIIREKCQNFIIQLIKQLRQRLPSNINVLKKIDFFSVVNSLKVIKPNIFLYFEKEFFNYSEEEKTEIEIQWHKLTTISWTKLSSTVDFWIDVREYKNAVDENPFFNLSNLVFSFLLLPLSNAEVERVFSTMNIVKTKQRNSLKANTLNSILTIRFGLKRLQKCCENFEISKELLKLYIKKNIYCEENMSDDSFEDEIFDF